MWHHRVGPCRASDEGTRGGKWWAARCGSGFAARLPPVHDRVVPALISRRHLASHDLLLRGPGGRTDRPCSRLLLQAVLRLPCPLYLGGF